MMSNATKLRELMKSTPCVVAPGCYDCITARLIERTGFEAVYMSGGCTACMLGYPDYGLTTMTEIADNAGRIASAVTVPVIADADTGYGNELNVIRTVREYERRGVAALHLEDQQSPKKCGHLDNKVLAPLEEFTSKIRAAVSARTDMLIIARTDARAVAGFDEAIRRMNAALEAGADIAFFEAPQTLEETARIPKLINGPCLLNVVWGGKSPLLDVSKAAEMGYKLAIVPGLLLQHVMGCCEDVLSELHRTNVHPVRPHDVSIVDMFRRMGSESWDTLRSRFS